MAIAFEFYCVVPPEEVETVTLQVAVMPPEFVVQVITAEPGLLAVITPLLLTTATERLLLLQVTDVS